MKDESPKRTKVKIEKDEDLSPPRHPPKAEEAKHESGLRTKQQFAVQHEAEYEKKMATLRALGSAGGAGAATVVRDETGRRLTAEEVEERRKKLQEGEKDKPMEWGKGLVQKRQAIQRAMDENGEKGESSFGRSKDDFRMNEMLKQQERWGDPMLQHVKKNQKIREEKEQLRSKGPRRVARPMYQGDPWPNRFSIKPGYRWDGVDRSNGWEAKIVLAFGEAKVRSEQGYKWGAADM